MECLRDLGIPLKHQLCLFVGTDEERGMEDLDYYIKNYPAPRLSMVADSGFPVCYGEKGIVEGCLKCPRPLWEGILELDGGSASNMIPDMACAVLKRTDAIENEVKAALNKETINKENLNMEVVFEKEGIRIIARGKSRHSAFPQGSVNAIFRLMGFLAGLKSLPSEDAELFGRLAFLSEEYFGEHMGIAYEDQVSGQTTCAATLLKMVGGKGVSALKHSVCHYGRSE